MEKKKEEKKKISPKRQGVANRFSRIAGQCMGIKKMAEDEKPCAEILQQVMAIKAAVNAAAIEVIRKECDTKELDEEVVKTLMKFI